MTAHIHIPRPHKKPAHDPLDTVDKKDRVVIEEGLKAIYGEEKTDFTKLERPQGWLTRLLVWVIAGLGMIALTAWGGFFFYARYMAVQNPTTFSLALEGPDTLKSGEHTSFTILYRNPTNVPIASLAIQAHLPDGFHLENANPPPIDTENPSWDIGFMSAGSDGKITLEGTWIVGVPSSTPLQAFATFRPGNFNSDFQDVATKTVTTTESVLTTRVVAPPDMTAGVAQTFTFTVTNTASTPVSGVSARLTLPSGFYLESSTLLLEGGAPPIWNLEELPPGGTSDLVITGSFAADVQGVEQLEVAYVIADANGDRVQAIAKGVTEVKASDIHLSLVAQGSADRITPALGSNVAVTIAIENTSAAAMNNLALLLDVGGDKTFPISWKQADLDGGTLTKDGILWDAETVGTIKAKENHTFNLRLPLVTTLASGMGDRFTLSAVLKRGTATIRSSPITAILESDAAISASAVYFTEDGIPLGNGPLPPVVEQTTTYRINWSLTNTLHPLSPVTVSATLPAGVTFAQQNTADLGVIKFDSATNTVRWEIPSLSTEVKSTSATFAVSITPTDTDIGTFMKLLSGTSLHALDTETQTEMERMAESLDTELPDDPFAEGKGTVTEE